MSEEEVLNEVPVPKHSRAAVAAREAWERWQVKVEKPDVVPVRRKRKKAKLKPAKSYQAWQTPRHIFGTIEADLGPFSLDAAASEANALCPKFLTEMDNALSERTRWGDDPEAYVWCNPPYKKILPWLERAEFAVKSGECARVVMLLPAQVSAKWFIKACALHEVQLFAGRIAFDLPDGLKNSRTPAISNCLVVIGEDALRGVSAIRDAKTGKMLHDLTELA